MDFFTAVLYGLIQGISEFLPISSSGHLALLPYLMHFKDPGVLFDLCMHIGTALAVIIYFRAETTSLIREAIGFLKDRKSTSPQQLFFRNFSVATILSVVLILALMPFSGMARSPWVIAFNQAFFGIVLWFADRSQRQNSSQKGEGYFSQGLRWREAAIVGLAQAFAIFPGVSRSGITLSAAFFMGVHRREAGAFSFLLSLPIIFSAVVVELPKIAHEQEAFNPLILLVGIAVSFIVGIATIHFFIKLIGKIQLGWFTLYRLALALALTFLLLR